MPALRHRVPGSGRGVRLVSGREARGARGGDAMMRSRFSTACARALASMQQDMNDLGFGTVANDAVGHLDQCDYGQPCLATTTGCLKGQCSRRNPAVTYAKPTHLVLAVPVEPGAAMFL